MPYDFDAPVDRAGSWSVRWNRFAGTDVLPLWVADMDFRAPAPVLEAFCARVAHGVFGYTGVPEGLREALAARLQRLYDWTIEPQWLVFLPGVVPGLHLAVRTLTAPLDRVIFPSPVYHPFKRAAERRPHETIALALRNGHWVIDLQQLEDACRRGARLLLLCNPQNPGGSIYTPSELQHIAALAERYDLLVCSDEIHADLVLDRNKRHVPIASLAPEIGKRTVTLGSPNKAFNVPGAGCGFAVIENAQLRKAFCSELHALVPEPGIFSYAAALAAYGDAESEAWLAALLDYLSGNRDLIEASVRSMPGLRLAHVEATCLAWIDASAWQVADPSAHVLKHGLALSPGALFGAAGFMRLNFGTQRSNVLKALERLEAAARAL